MDYGQIFADTLRLIWRQKKLWVLGICGLLAMAAAQMVSILAGLNWQRDLIRFINLEMVAPRSRSFGFLPQELVGMLATFAGAMGFALLFTLLGYVVNLAVRAGTVQEAARAWQGESVGIERGLRGGLGQMPRFFVLDLIWSLPVLLFVVLVYLVAFGMVVGVVATVGAASGSELEPAPFLGIVGALMALVCTGLLLVLLFLLIYNIFAPLMYQSIVQRGHGLGAAIQEGWQLGRRHWLSMLILALLTWAIGALLALVVQAATAALGLSAMVGWSSSFAEALNRDTPTLPLPNLALMAIIAPLTAATTLLVSSFIQTFGLTLYARAYQEFTRTQ